MKTCSAEIIFRYNSPAGQITLGSIGDAICLCDWQNYKGEENHNAIIDSALVQLEEYFAGQRTEFDIKVCMNGTEFQKLVWEELKNIPYGTTTSYAEIARRIGRPKSVRAVANAIGANPISIIIPCHRVIGSNGHITGYSGGLFAKRTLLELEGLSLF